MEIDEQLARARKSLESIRSYLAFLKAIQMYKKPYIDINMNDPRPVEDVITWIMQENIGVLNVAGNSEQSSPGIQTRVIEYLEMVFRGLLATPS